MSSTVSNKVKFGLSNVHYALITEGTDGSITYGTPVALPNAQSMTADPESSTTKCHADNQLIFAVTTHSGETISLKMARISDDFLVNVLGWKQTTDGQYVQPTDAICKKFALMYEIKGDQKKSRRWFFQCTAQIGSDSADSDADSVTFASDTITITAYPVALADGNHYIKAKLNEDATAYATFFTAAPTLPVVTA